MAAYYKDVDGYWQADRGVVPPMIAGVFEDDVQGSKAYCEKVLDKIDSALSDPSFTWSGNGNAYSITISKEGMTIACLWDETTGSLTLPLDQAKPLINEWLLLFSA